MAALDLLRSRQALAAGVGTTTRRNRVLPAVAAPAAIPARSGSAQYALRRIATALRGFVARVVNATRAARFAHDTLVVSDAAYPIYGHSYSVLPFATPFNVLASDTSKLQDVISFHDGEVLVNAQKMPLLAITGAAPAGALPWLIPHPTPVGELGRYGDAVTNATVKRVFAVGRASVHAWADSGVDVALGGAAYRPDKALACGARIDAATHEAWLSQLVYTGYSWDDLGGGWMVHAARVAMLLTAPYLQKTDSTAAVDQASCIPQDRGVSSILQSDSVALPEAELCVYGAGVPLNTSYAYAQTELWATAGFPLTDVVKYTVPGNQILSGARSRWDNSLSTQEVVAGCSLSISAGNTLIVDNVNESYWFDAFNHELFASNGGGSVFTDEGRYNYITHTLIGWSIDSSNPAPDKAPRSRTGTGVYAHGNGTLPSTASYLTASQTGGFVIALSSIELVRVNFSRARTTGSKVQVAAITGRYANPLANPTTTELRSPLPVKVSMVTMDTEASYAQLMATGPARVALIQARLQDYVGKNYYAWYDNDSQSSLYTSSVVQRTPTDDTALSWSTRDFILYDEADACFISIDATFSGAQSYGAAGAATLDVVLRIDTPAGVVTQPLFHSDLAYLTLLPEQELITGVTYVPSPKQRALFTPLYQAQGDFKGAAYTTAAEVAAGATAAYLFNFVLTLDTYAAVGTDTGTLPEVHFIPCNLLEMLYAYVFSQAYGVDAFERYPVTFTTRFTEFQNTLFANQWRVSYRNGALTDWLDTLGGAYVTEQTTELYRT